jgi:hypothetical protein
LSHGHFYAIPPVIHKSLIFGTLGLHCLLTKTLKFSQNFKNFKNFKIFNKFQNSKIKTKNFLWTFWIFLKFWNFWNFKILWKFSIFSFNFRILKFVENFEIFEIFDNKYIILTGCASKDKKGKIKYKKSIYIHPTTKKQKITYYHKNKWQHKDGP